MLHSQPCSVLQRRFITYYTARNSSQCIRVHTFKAAIPTVHACRGPIAHAKHHKQKVQEQQQVQDAAKPRSIQQQLAAALPPAAIVAAAALALAAPAATAAAGGFGTTYVPGLVGDSPFNEGFVSSFLLILFSEIGDKTFFIAVLLALQQSRSAVFAGTFGALAVMTVVSVGLGQVFHQLDELLPGVPGGFPLDDALAVALLVFFGLQTLAGAFKEGGDDEQEEAKEVVAAFGGGASATLVLSTFALVFAAEWGDKSFLATIALAAASSPAGVIAGAVTGHGVATALAVLGGSVLGKYASEKLIQVVGGSLFLVFAAATTFDIVKGVH